MTYETIRLDIADNIATITLNRPERLNACGLEMAGEINDALATELGNARCLIITGAGKGFCSGADLSKRGDSSITGGEGGVYCAHPPLQPADDEFSAAQHASDYRGERRGGGGRLFDRAVW